MGNVLVAFFSASGVTEGVAKKLADAAVVEGKRLASGVSESDLSAWVKEF